MMAMTPNQKPQVRNSERVATCSTVASRPSIVATRSLSNVRSGRVVSRSVARCCKTNSPAMCAPACGWKPAISARICASVIEAYLLFQCSICSVRASDMAGVVMPNDQDQRPPPGDGDRLQQNSPNNQGR